MDAYASTSSGRNVTVVANGATLVYNGSGVAVEMIKSNGINQGQNVWIGGDVNGPGSGTSGSKGFVTRDSARNVVRPQQLDGFDVCVQVRNENEFCEYQRIGGFRAPDFNTCVEFLSGTATGGAGTASFRGSLVEDIAANPPGGSYTITMDQDAFFYGSIVRNINAQVPASGDAAVHLQGSVESTKIDGIVAESGASDGAGAAAVLIENISNWKSGQSDQRSMPRQISNLYVNDQVTPVENQTSLNVPPRTDRDVALDLGGNEILDAGPITTETVDSKIGINPDSDGEVPLKYADTEHNILRCADGTHIGTAGPAWCDSSGTWHSLVDGSTYTP
jgi:hypothetical protein